MTVRVNGGVLNGQFVTGSLSYFKIAHAEILAADLGTVVAVTGAAKPIEKAVRVIQTQASIAILHVVDGTMYVALENSSENWTAAQLVTALSPAAFTTAPTVAEVPFVLA